MFILSVSYLTISNLPFFHEPNIPGSYAVLLVTSSDFTFDELLG